MNAARRSLVLALALALTACLGPVDAQAPDVDLGGATPAGLTDFTPVGGGAGAPQLSADARVRVLEQRLAELDAKLQSANARADATGAKLDAVVAELAQRAHDAAENAELRAITSRAIKGGGDPEMCVGGRVRVAEAGLSTPGMSDFNRDRMYVQIYYKCAP